MEELVKADETIRRLRNWLRKVRRAIWKQIKKGRKWMKYQNMITI